MKKILLVAAILFGAYFSKAQWIEQSSGSTHWFSSLCFVNETTGWICGFNGSDNMLIRTNDGGENWVPFGIPTTQFVPEVRFLNETTGWAVGQNGLLLKSTDGGENWETQDVGTNITLQSVCFVNENKGWVVGQQGVIFHSTDGGESWTAQTSGTSTLLVSVRFVDEMIGWICGWGGVILYTSNGGETWTTQTSPTFFNLGCISIVDQNNVWMSGAPGGGRNEAWDNGVIIHTSDGGANWVQQYISSELTNSVCFVDLNNGWFFGSTGTIMYSGDGGVTWDAQTTDVTNIFTIGQMVDLNNGWVTGGDGIIMHTINGGGITGIEDNSPGKSMLALSNSPNPFSGSTTLTFNIPSTTKVEISVFDVCGKNVATLLSEEMSSGRHNIEWNASGLTNGVYFCRISAANSSVTKKMIIR